jgi:type II secretory ATPase GspE/PulE/Tfp pilus assembly ATPase PilB-like protein
MSDLSQPPLSLVPMAPDGAGAVPVTPPADEIPPGTPLSVQWPDPPLAGLLADLPPLAAEPCEIESPNGKVSLGQLLGFDPATGQVHLQLPPSRNALSLKPRLFRRLTLLRPLPPRRLPGAPNFEATTPLAGPASLTSLKLQFKNGQPFTLSVAAQVESAAGLFTFAPMGTEGHLQRSFFPRDGLKAEAPAASDPGSIDFSAATEPMALDLPTPAKPTTTATPSAPTRQRSDMVLAPRIDGHSQLLQAIDRQARMPMVRIGEALLGLGFVTESQLNQALEWQRQDHRYPLGEMLVRENVISRTNLQVALARKMGYPIVEVSAFPAESEAAMRLPQATARRLPALPLVIHKGQLVVALEDPSSREAIDEIEFTAQCKVVPVLAPAGTLKPAIDRLYQRLGKEAGDISPGGMAIEADANSARGLLASMVQQQGGEALDDDTPIEQSDNSLVRLINTMILEAREQGVSDIHIECQPGTDKVKVRFRRDGVLRPYIELPHTYRSAMVARIKIMCDLDISERRKPQDGKINFGRFMQGQRLELRVATIPTANGLEDVVMRLLASARTLPLDGMGLQPDTLAQLKNVIERPYGMVLCVGPTGSGKTTTLHAALGHINTPERKIWTAEDPVEITQAGLRQVQVNPKIDWTFAKALRAFLRADPDVVMVGEIRDAETAQMAIEASLTGHLVMSTLHTNSAPETVTRLLDMGMDPFSFADSLLAVLAQRLVRRWCKHCVTQRPATADEQQMLVDEYLHAYPDPAQRPDGQALLRDWQARFGLNGVLQHSHAPGCPQCDQSGFGGRVGLHEMLVVSRELRRLIQTNGRAEDLQRVAMHEGMRTLRQDGILKVLAGLTAIEEVRATSNG